MDLPGTDLEDHVVVLGCGRVGGFVARMLWRLEQPFVVVDADPGQVDAAREEGLPVVYGDATAEPVLEATGVREARLVILTVPDAADARMAVERVRALNPEVHVVVRSTGTEQLEDLSRLGVYEAVQPEFEAGLELGRQALVHLGVETGEIQRFSDRVRRELYAPISGWKDDDGLLTRLRRASEMIETDWVSLEEGSPVAGRTLGDLRVRRETGASVVAVVRGDEVIANPGADLVLATDDLVGVLGTREQRASFFALAQGSPR